MAGQLEEKAGIKNYFLKNKNLQILIIIAGVFLLLQIGLAWYLLDGVKNRPNGQNLTTLQESKFLGKKEILDLSNSDPEVGGVVEKVSKHILLPSKKFTVATVNDAEKLIQTNPALYQYARNGQKLLIYDTGAIVYDSVLDKVVDVIQDYPARLRQLQEMASSAAQNNK